MNSDTTAKKILYITVRSDTGGGPRHLFDLVSSLKGKGIIPYIAAPETPPYGEKFRDISHKYMILPERAISIVSFFKLLRFLKREGLTLIHSHGRGAGIYSRLLRIVAPIQIIHTFHGIHREKSFLGKIKFLLDYALTPLGHSYICVGEDERRKALRLLPLPAKKVTVINNGVDTASIRSQYGGVDTMKAREIFSIGTKKFVVGYLSRLDFQKGVDILLSTLIQWKRLHSDIPFYTYIAGKGDEEKHLKAMVHKFGLDRDVFFTGEIENPMVFLRALDLYVSFSRGEGLPMAVLEAMTCSLPCLLSDVEGHRELAKKGGVQLFSLGDSRDFESKINRLMTNPKERKSLGRKGTELVTNHYGLERMVCETLSLY